MERTCVHRQLQPRLDGCTCPLVLPGTVFTMTFDSTTKALSASESNPLPACCYNARAAYADRDPLMGGVHGVAEYVASRRCCCWQYDDCELARRCHIPLRRAAF